MLYGECTHASHLLCVCFMWWDRHVCVGAHVHVCVHKSVGARGQSWVSFLPYHPSTWVVVFFFFLIVSLRHCVSSLRTLSKTSLSPPWSAFVTRGLGAWTRILMIYELSHLSSLASVFKRSLPWHWTHPDYPGNQASPLDPYSHLQSLCCSAESHSHTFCRLACSGITGGVALLEEMCQWGWTLMFQKCIPGPVSHSLLAACWSRCRPVSYLSSNMSVCILPCFPSWW